MSNIETYNTLNSFFSVAMNNNLELQEALLHEDGPTLADIAEALGFDSVDAMNKHQEWLDSLLAHHKRIMSYQNSPEAIARVDRYVNEGGNRGDIVMVMPQDDDNGPSM